MSLRKAFLPLLIFGTTGVAAADPGDLQERVDSTEDVTIGLLRDGAYIMTAPLRPTKKGLLITFATLGAGAAIMGFDRHISNSVQHSKHRGLKKIFKGLDEDEGIERFGRSSGVMMTCAAFYGGGILTHSPKAKRVAFIGVEAWLYNDTVSKLFKAGLGRARPGARDPYDFDSFSGKSSLPSGHTSTAFCLATVISSEYKSGLVATAAYGTATMVGFSRLYRDVHWASDVVVSAVLGVAIGKATHDLYGTNPRNWEIILDGQGAKVSRKF